MQLAKADPLLSLLGLRCSGDLGPLTLWTSRFHAVLAYPRAKPKKPPTPTQQAQRVAFKMAAAAWRECPEAVKDRYRRYCKITHPPYTPYNLFLSVMLKPDPDFDERMKQIIGDA